MPTERTKWNTDSMPAGYPKECNTELVKEVVQDLNDEYVARKKSGKNNPLWEGIIRQEIEAGNEELRQRTPWFSMNNPFVYVSVILLIAFLAYLAYTLEWPLRFGSN